MKVVELYLKREDGEYVPVSFEKVLDKSWKESLILVTVGSYSCPADHSEVDEIFEGLDQCDALKLLRGASFMIVKDSVKFENLGPNNVGWEKMMIKEEDER
jgi:hypothetical protein